MSNNDRMAQTGYTKSCTAGAIRHELANPGKLVGGRSHAQKGKDFIRGLENWLKNNPNASASDGKIAQDLISDLRSALNGR